MYLYTFQLFLRRLREHVYNKEFIDKKGEETSRILLT